MIFRTYAVLAAILLILGLTVLAQGWNRYPWNNQPPAVQADPAKGDHSAAQPAPGGKH